MKWFFSHPLVQVGDFSQLLQYDRFEDLMKIRNDFQKEFYFENVVQTVHSDYQNVKRDSVQYVQNLKKQFQKMSKQCLLISLPIGVSCFFDELGAATCIYSD